MTQTQQPADPMAIVDRVAQKSDQATQRAAAAAEVERVTEAEGLDALDDSEALDLLLSCEPAEQIQTVELDPRKGTTKPLLLTLRSITEQEWETIKDQCEIRPNRQQRRARGEEVILDNNLMARLLVKTATTNVNWNDANLRSRFKVQTGEDVIRKVLLYGEIANLAGTVMTISGFDDDLVRFVGNSSDGAEKPAS